MSQPSWTPDSQTPVVFASLSGDHNPVHLDPEHARGAGFDDVIVHGMCTLGAAARAAQLAVAPGSVLRKIDVRFANPVLPGETVGFDWGVKEKDGAHKVGLKTVLPGARKVMSPANFTFVSAEAEVTAPSDELVAADDGDIAGEPFSFTEEQLAQYNGITAATETPEGEGVPMMVSLLGMTGALEIAFRTVQPPERAGTWVHLRQAAEFFADVKADEVYRCRIQTARNKIRESKVGVMITIPFVVERDRDGGLVSTGSCGLFYAFTEDS
ncbi:MAG: MaoC family dehydratase [Deltaproteobacteria bacterium]|nr:MaoC family dehydratase [Deltaproteobacteria bacterium]